MKFLGMIRFRLVVLVLSIQFRIKSFRQKKMINIFAVEDDSAWQLHRLFNRVDDPKMRANVFDHLLEETYHASVFLEQVKKEFGRVTINWPQPRLEIETADQPDWKYFAHLHAGESSAALFFKALQEAVGKSSFTEKVNQVLSDEAKHVGKTASPSKSLNVSNDVYADYAQKVGQSRWWDSITKSLQIFLDLLLTAFLVLLYFSVIPFVFWFSNSRMNETSFTFSNNQRKSF